MSEPRPRRWFQLHLTTAIVLMLVAAGLVWANMTRKPYWSKLHCGRAVR